MANTIELQRFYARKAWMELRWMLIVQRFGVCARCGKSFADDTSKLIAHHKIALTEKTINDPLIALNPDNIEIVCNGCHNHMHHRGLSKDRQVVIVWGAPLAGKTTYVREQMMRGDLVVDMDSLNEAVSGCERYDRPDELKPISFLVRDALLEAVRMRVGHWTTAYIIGSYARKDERERLAARLGGVCVEVEAEKEDCYARLDGRFDHDDEKRKIWKNYIDKWFVDVQR
ncbi:MAG: AAA family ATPase [Flexilinea sp.]